VVWRFLGLLKSKLDGDLANTLDLGPAIGTALEMGFERRQFAIRQLAEDVAGDVIVDVVIHLLVLNIF
jgi:hypothetical protein